MRFEFATAGRVLFGAGSVKDLAPAARSMGSRVLVVTGRSRERPVTTTRAKFKTCAFEKPPGDFDDVLCAPFLVGRRA